MLMLLGLMLLGVGRPRQDGDDRGQDSGCNSHDTSSVSIIRFYPTASPRHMIWIMSDIFSALELAVGPSGVSTVSLAPQQALFRQDDPTRGMFLLRSGRVDLMRHTASGVAARIHAARAGETFAEASLYSDRYHCDAVAVSASEAIQFHKGAVLAALARQPELASALSHHLAASLREARRRLELLFVTPLSDRLFLRLADLADDDGTMPPRTAMKAVAEDIGATPEATYRALADLERQGRLDRVGRGKVRLRTAPQA